jgi:transmembrane sensor
MDSNKDKPRDAIAEEAGEWFVANDDGPLDARDAADLAAWFKASPVHIEEFLGVSAVASDLKQAGADPEYSMEAILARARAEADTPVEVLRPRGAWIGRGRPAGRRFVAAATLAAGVLLGVGVLLRWGHGPGEPLGAAGGITALHFETRHGEQLTQRLEDHSVLHLNTDTAVSIRYSKSERLVVLSAGQATFEVAHEANRAFRVHAGSAEVLDLGTKFDVRVEPGSTVVTVVEGRVAVVPTNSSPAPTPALRLVELGADQQIRVADGVWPATPVAVDAERTTAWLHRQIVFDNEPLERVAAEFNRYTAKRIEIATPALRKLRVSGVFATDDTDAFVAFLRSLKGVRVEVTATQIRVSGG